jgi:integrase/recombinase XerC
MIKGFLFYMVNTIDAFRDYLQKEKSILTYRQCLFERCKNFQSFNETHFAQETIEDVNYRLEVGLWRLWMGYV